MMLSKKQKQGEMMLVKKLEKQGPTPKHHDAYKKMSVLCLETV